MAAGGFKTFVAGEILTSADTNDFLMQGVLVFADATARDVAITSPVEGQFVFRTDEDVLEFFDGTEFVEVSGEAGAAVISATTGSPTETTITDDGVTFDVFEFTGDGTITVAEAGLVHALIVGGGAAGPSSFSTSAAGGGGAGGFYENENLFLSAGTFTVIVGPAGFPAGASSVGPYEVGFGGGGGSANGTNPESGGSGCGGHSGNTKPGRAVVPTAGNDGGQGNGSGNISGGGGGGAGGSGVQGFPSVGGNGGAGKESSITGTALFYAAGGGGGSITGTVGTGGSGIGGNGGLNNNGTAASPANRGSGGGGACTNGVFRAGGAGSSGVVIVRVAV